MKEEITEFKKSYTRDTTIIIQQFWFKAQKKVLEKEPNQFKITGIDYVSEGAVEVWENALAISKIKQILRAQSFSNTNNIIRMLTDYEKELQEIYPIWEKGFLDSYDELREFVKKIERLTFEDLILSYLGADNSCEPKVYKITMRLRSEDHFFANNDLVIRKSLENIYPKIKNYSICILESEFLNNQIPSLNECKKRFKNFVVINDEEKFVESLDNFRKINPQYIFLTPKIEDNFLNGEIKGRIAQSGLVKGTVRILMLQNQIDKIQQGDVIVSPMTTPTFMSAIKKAGAIITDEGGIICHAAIISRELNIPCITSTKIATQVLHDGDIVEVDADRGIVKIIKKA